MAGWALVALLAAAGPAERERAGRASALVSYVAADYPTAVGPGREILSAEELAEEGQFLREAAAELRALAAEDLAGEVFNLGNPDERTIADFARAVQEACGVRLPVVRRPLPTDDPTRRCPDIGKARRLLGWSPAISLEEGLRRTIAYFRSELAHPLGARADAPHADA